MHSKSLQSCLSLCDHMDYSPPGFFVHGVPQARILAWIAMPSSRGSSQPRDQTHVSYITCICRRIGKPQLQGISSVQWLSRAQPLQPQGRQQARPLSPSPTPRAYSNSCPLSQPCHSTISSSVASFSSYPQSFPASGFFPVTWLFVSSGQSIGVSASASVFPRNIQDWFLLGWTRVAHEILWLEKCWTLQGAFCYRIWDGNAFVVLKYKQLPWNAHEPFLLSQGKVYKKW